VRFFLEPAILSVEKYAKKMEFITFWAITGVQNLDEIGPFEYNDRKQV
jgi:hypothetical protein